MSGDRCDLCEVFAPVYCPGCLQKAEEDTRTATVREIAEALSKDFSFVDKIVEQDERLDLDAEFVESALWSLLGGEPES